MIAAAIQSDAARRRVLIRLVALGAALSVNSLFFWLIAASTVGVKSTEHVARRTTTVRLVSDPIPVQPPLFLTPPTQWQPASVQHRPSTRAAMKKTDLSQAARATAAPPSLVILPPDPAALDLSDAQTSKPLVLDGAALNQAAKQTGHSGMGVRAMAQAAGVPLNSKAAPDQALGENVRQAARGDCRTAHSDKGLLAIPMLLWDAATEKGCRW